MGVDNTTLHPIPKHRRRRSGTTPALEVVAGGRRGETFLLSHRAVVVGTHERADIRLDDTGVSRRHAKVVVTADGGVSVVDLASSNGTFVEEVRVDVASLREGDRLHIGPAATLRLRYCAPDERAGPTPKLSDRQIEVAELVAEGLSNAAIAEALSISPRTVARHVDNIYARLGLHSRTALARWVFERRRP